MKKRSLVFAAIALALAIPTNAAAQTATPTATGTPTSTATATVLASITATPTATASVTRTPPAATTTASPASTATAPPAPTVTPSSTATPTQTPVPVLPVVTTVGDMVPVPSGPFLHGNPAVTWTLHSYWIDRYVVRADDFAAFLTANGNPGPSAGTDPHYTYWKPNYWSGNPGVPTIQQTGSTFRAIPGYEAYPANELLWWGADAYCRAHGKRLPTEAEWEKAARGTDGRTYPWGEAAPNATLARFGQSAPGTWAGMSLDSLAAVSAYPQGMSVYGAYQMAGNVWEWVNDWYDAGYYGYAPTTDPQGPSSPQTNPAYKILRGGEARDTNMIDLATYGRTPHEPWAQSPATGFRCAMG